MSKKVLASSGEITAWLWGEFSSMAAINSLALACFSSQQEMDLGSPPVGLTLMLYPNMAEVTFKDFYGKVTNTLQLLCLGLLE